jgi:hypothetical protein
MFGAIRQIVPFALLRHICGAFAIDTDGIMGISSLPVASAIPIDERITVAEQLIGALLLSATSRC